MPEHIAIIAGRYPSLSETFVYREVAGLASMGCRVTTVSLHPGEQVAGIAPAHHLVYRGNAAVAVAAIWELFRFPICTLQTVATGLRDMCFPGESMPIAGRLKLVAQVIAATASADALRKAGVEHIHCHFAHAPTTVGMYLAMQLGVSFSFVGHANDLFQRRSLLRRKLERAAFVSCISHWHRELYVSLVPASADRYRIIRCGVDVENWRPKELRDGPALHIVSVCRMVEKKGIDTLIRALGLLRSNDSPLAMKVTIAGEGPELGRLKALAESLGVGGQISWAGGVPNMQVRELMADADLFVLPCREDSNGDRDGIPVVLMEAMACGVPVISGDLPAIRELVIDGQTGRLVDGRSPEQLADAILELASDFELRQRLAGAAAEHVRSEFSLRVNIDRVRNAIEGAVVSKGSRQ